MPDWLHTACIPVQWNGHVVGIDNSRIHKRVMGKMFRRNKERGKT